MWRTRCGKLANSELRFEETLFVGTLWTAQCRTRMDCQRSPENTKQTVEEVVYRNIAQAEKQDPGQKQSAPNGQHK